MGINKEAESKASLYLRQKGFKILSRNRRIANIEIDIIAFKIINNQKHVYFVEVKQMRRKYHRLGFNAFSKKQLNRYKRSIKTLYSAMGYTFPCHISLIIIDENLLCIDFFEDYFIRK